MQPVLAKGGGLRLGMAMDGLCLLNVGCGAAFLPWHGLKEAAVLSGGSAAWEGAVVFSIALPGKR